MRKRTSTALAAIVIIATAAAPDAAVSAQGPPGSVSLEEALELFHRNSPELQLSRGRLLGGLGRARQERALPNPLMSVTHEALGDYSESYVNLSQPIGFLWESRPRRDGANAIAAGARARFAADSAMLVLDLKRTWVAAWREREAVEAIRLTDDLVADVLASAEARFAEGDLAGYDLRRLRLERSQSSRRLAMAVLGLEEAERRLGSLLAQTDEYSRIAAADPVLAGVGFAVPGDPVEIALAQRPEIASARAAVDALRAESQLTRTSAFQSTSLTGGVKRQSDGADGIFVGLSIPLPLADRRGGASDAAQAAVVSGEAELELLRRTIARQVSLAAARLETAGRQLQLLSPDGIQEARELLAIARLAYAEGEMRVVDLLDAAETFVDARLFDSQVRSDSWDAVFEMEMAIGGFPAEADNGASQ